jgi:hypothetical protein
MPENQTKVNHKIIGEVPKCLLPLCQGWLVDTFSEKYWIRCLDPRHNNQRRIEIEEATSQSTLLNQPERSSQRKKRMVFL